MYFKLGKKKKKALKKDAATSELFAPEEGKKDNLKMNQQKKTYLADNQNR